MLGVQALTALATGTPEQLSTMATLYAVLVGLIVLFRVCMPFNRNRVVLFIGCCVLFVGAIYLLPVWFSLVALERSHVLMVLAPRWWGDWRSRCSAKGWMRWIGPLEKKLAHK